MCSLPDIQTFESTGATFSRISLIRTFHRLVALRLHPQESQNHPRDKLEQAEQAISSIHDYLTWKKNFTRKKGNGERAIDLAGNIRIALYIPQLNIIYLVFSF